jgi:hypothetical protein
VGPKLRPGPAFKVPGPGCVGAQLILTVLLLLETTPPFEVPVKIPVALLSVISVYHQVKRECAESRSGGRGAGRTGEKEIPEIDVGRHGVSLSV